MEGPAQVTVRLSRQGGRLPPADDEHLAVAPDGSFTMWRSNSTGAAGRFAGRLDDADLAALLDEARKAAAAGDLTIHPYPDDAVETVEADGARASMGGSSQPEGAWTPLVGRLRRLLGELTAFPVAAVALEVSEGGRRAALVHRGREPLRLDLSRLAVRAVLWGPNWWLLGDWRAPEVPPGLEAPLDAGPSWSLEIPFAHGFEAGPDRTVQAFAELAVLSRGMPVQVGLTALTPLSSDATA